MSAALVRNLRLGATAALLVILCGRADDAARQRLDLRLTELALRAPSKALAESVRHVQAQSTSSELACVAIDGYSAHFILAELTLRAFVYAPGCITPQDAIAHGVRACDYACAQPGAPERLFLVLKNLITVQEQAGMTARCDSAACRVWMSALAEGNNSLEEMVSLHQALRLFNTGLTNESLGVLEELRNKPWRAAPATLATVATCYAGIHHYAMAFGTWLDVLRWYGVTDGGYWRTKAVAALDDLLAFARDQDVDDYHTVRQRLPMSVAATRGNAACIAQLREVVVHDPTVYEKELRVAMGAPADSAEQTLARLGALNPFDTPPTQARFIEELAYRACVALGDAWAQQGAVTNALQIWLDQMAQQQYERICMPLQLRIERHSSAMSEAQTNQYCRLLRGWIVTTKEQHKLLQQYPGGHYNGAIKLVPDRDLLYAIGSLSEAESVLARYESLEKQ
jgi:hypothetical protein